MNPVWLTRFELNLPCRPIDLEEMRQTVPELLDENLEESPVRKAFFYVRPWLYTDFLRELRQWIHDAQHDDRTQGHAAVDCPLDLCPLKTAGIEQHSGRPSTGGTQDAEPGVLQLMTLGGMIGAREASRKRPKSTQANDYDSASDFRKLLQKVHPNDDGKNIEIIVLTDPYLHMEFDQGKTYLLKYLKTIGLPKGSTATVKISPRIKSTSAGFKKIEQAIKSEFQNVSLTHHSQKRRFHDRFFLVHYKNGVARGVFGPSLNSFASSDLYLMGELEPHCIAALTVKEL